MTTQIITETDTDATAVDTTRADIIAGMRELLNFLEAHPEIAVMTQHYIVYVSADELKQMARIGGWQKVYEGQFFTLRRHFSGGQKLDIYTNREAICRKVVTGTRVVPAQPAVEEHTEDVEEWVCDDVSLLAERAK